jgi:4-hydroxy-tetrahydrodipicolinate synthase
MTTRPFHGIKPPLVTPLADRDALDQPGLERLVERVIAGGVNGVFILGTTGEAPSLSYRLRRELITRVCRQADGRVPVLVGVTDTAFIESVRLAQHAAEAGAAAVVLSTPYYFPAGQTELRGYVHNIVQQLPLPLVLYNMPGLTKVWFELETLRELTQLDGIVGIKDSSGDLSYFESLMSLRELRPDWSIMIGPEHLLARAMELGGDGGVSGGANIFPRLFVECYRAAAAGNAARLAELTALIGQLQGIYEIGKYGSRFIKATKCALSLLGVCSDFMAEPFHHFHPPERARVEAILKPLLEKLQ